MIEFLKCLILEARGYRLILNIWMHVLFRTTSRSEIENSFSNKYLNYNLT